MKEEGTRTREDGAVNSTEAVAAAEVSMTKKGLHLRDAKPASIERKKNNQGGCPTFRPGGGSSPWE
jgi:hypothetical protein